MKVSFPIETVVKLGGSDNILKLYIPSKNDHWISKINSSNVILHIGELAICNPTPDEWSTYHSFNNSIISDWLKDNDCSIDDSFSFVGVEDVCGKLHLILVASTKQNQTK